MRTFTLALAFAGLGLAQSPIFKSDIETVRVDVLVTRDGRPVTDLQLADFEVLDNGIVQRIDHVASEELPLNVVLTIDGSSSLAGDPARRLQSACLELLSELQERDKAALVTFGEAVSVRTGLTNDLPLVRSALDEPFEGGQTSLVDAVQTSVLLTESEPGRALVLVFTDGIEVSSYLPAQSLLETIKRSDAIVYGVAVRGIPRPPFLRDLAKSSGGDMLEVDSASDVALAFKHVLNEFRQRYLLSYSPAGSERGGWHQLKVRVKSRGAVVNARPGYSR